MFFKNADDSFIGEVSDAFSRFGINSEETFKGKSKDTTFFKMFDSIHDSTYIAVGKKKSSGKKTKEAWNEIIDRDLIPNALKLSKYGDAPAAALIVPSQDLGDVAELLKKRNVVPTTYQLFDGYAVAGITKAGIAQLVATEGKYTKEDDGDAAENEKPNEKPAEKAPEVPQNPDNIYQKAIDSSAPRPINSYSDGGAPKKPNIKDNKSGALAKKLAAAALLGIAAGVVPFAAKAIYDKAVVPKPHPVEYPELEIADKYFNDIKYGSDENVELLKSIVENPEVTKDYLEKLADSPVGIDVIKNPNAPADILNKAAVSEDIQKRINAAENPSTSLDTLKKLMNDSSPKVRAGVAKNPAISEDMMKKLLQDTPEVRESLLENTSLTPNMLDELSKNASKNCDFLKKSMANPCMAPDMLEYNSENPNECIREGLASNPNTPAEILSKLATDNNDRVRRNALKNEKLPQDRLEKIFESGANDPKTIEDRKAALANRAISPEIIRKAIAQNPKEYIKTAASNPRTPQDIMSAIKDIAHGKRGLEFFINNAMSAAGNKNFIRALEDEAKYYDGNIKPPLRNRLNKSFANNVFDPYKMASNDANILGKSGKNPRDKENKNKADKIYSVNDMKNPTGSFLENAPKELLDGENKDRTEKILDTADKIVNSVMQNMLPDIEKNSDESSAKKEGNLGGDGSEGGTGAGSPSKGAGGAEPSEKAENNWVDDRNKQDGGATAPSLNGAANSTPQDGLEYKKILFKNACEQIDELHKIF